MIGIAHPELLHNRLDFFPDSVGGWEHCYGWVEVVEMEE